MNILPTMLSHFPKDRNQQTDKNLPGLLHIPQECPPQGPQSLEVAENAKNGIDNDDQVCLIIISL